MEPEVTDYVYIEIEGNVTGKDSSFLKVDGKDIPREAIVNLRIKPRFEPGTILYSTETIFYIKIQNGDWIYSYDGSMKSEQSVMDMFNQGNLRATRKA